MTTVPTDRLVSKAEVVQMTSLSYPTLWRKMRAGTFPKALILSVDKDGCPSRIAWRQSEITTWIAGLAR